MGGCECQKAEEKFNELKNEIFSKFKSTKGTGGNNLTSENYIDANGKPSDEFSRYIFDQINLLREDPQSFIDMISNAKRFVTTDKTGIKIYKNKLKVALNSGEKAFDEAIETLKKTEPMNKLIYNPKLTIDLPDNESELKSKNYLVEQIQQKLDLEMEIKSFWKDNVKDPETCFILTVVDDYGAHAGNKRNDILDKKHKYIGISSVSIGNSFACYIVIA